MIQRTLVALICVVVGLCPWSKAAPRVRADAPIPKLTVIRRMNHGDTVHELALSGDKLLSFGVDEKLKIWDTQTGKLLHELDFTWSEELIYTDDFRFAAQSEKSDSGSGPVRVYDIASGNVLFTSDPIKDAWPVSIRPDGMALLYLSEQTGDMHLLSRNMDQIVFEADHGIMPGSVIIDPDWKTAAVGTDQGVDVWDIATDKLLRRLTFTATHKFRGQVSISQDRHYLMDMGGLVADFTTGQVVGTVSGVGFMFSPDSTFVIAYGAESTDSVPLHLWDIALHQDRTVITMETPHDHYWVSPNSAWLITSNVEYKLRFWSTQNGALLRTALEHSDLIQALAFNRTGDRMASGDKSGNIVISDVLSEP